MRQLLGGLLIGGGILIMSCSGLCSLAVVVIGFTEALREPSVVFLPLLIGGLPFLIGWGLLRWGRSLLRETPDGVD